MLTVTSKDSSLSGIDAKEAVILSSFTVLLLTLWRSLCWLLRSPA
ncbi:hypothetical protein [Limnospira platensis]